MGRIKYTLLVIVMISASNAQFTPDTTILYKTIDTVDLYLHAFYPANYAATDWRGSIVFFFGGGWNGGNPDQFFPHCDSLAQLGLVCFSAEYRVNSVHGTTPDTCVFDGNSAVRWIRKNARNLGIDPNKIAAGGGSAGGHVAAATSAIKGYDEASEDSNISSDPDALVLFNPVYDNGPNGYGHSRVQAYWESFSPMNNIDSSHAPTVVFLGTNDALIPVSTAETYDSLLKAHGVESRLFLYQDQAHGFFNEGRNNNVYYHLTMEETITFLDSLGYMRQDVFIINRDKKFRSPKIWFSLLDNKLILKRYVQGKPVFFDIKGNEVILK